MRKIQFINSLQKDWFQSHLEIIYGQILNSPSNNLNTGKGREQHLCNKPDIISYSFSYFYSLISSGFFTIKII